LALAMGLKTYKLKFGHRGANHPVKDLRTGIVEITTQNHGFAVNGEGEQPDGVEITHLNLNDMTVEGLACPSRYAFSAQYHPESSPGPHDSLYLFDRFRDEILRFKRDGGGG
jgi:carbamoyl-phosphate synthase small subunit